MLAMAAQTPRGIRLPALSLTTIASMLAPTGSGCGYFFMIDVNRSDSKSRCSHTCKRR